MTGRAFRMTAKGEEKVALLTLVTSVSAIKLD